MGIKRSERNTSLYGIYDTKDSYMCVGIFTAIEAAEYLGITYTHLFKGVRNKSVIMGRYKVERVRKGRKAK